MNIFPLLFRIAAFANFVMAIAHFFPGSGQDISMGNQYLIIGLLFSLYASVQNAERKIDEN